MVWAMRERQTSVGSCPFTNKKGKPCREKTFLPHCRQGAEMTLGAVGATWRTWRWNPHAKYSEPERQRGSGCLLTSSFRHSNSSGWPTSAIIPLWRKELPAWLDSYLLGFCCLLGSTCSSNILPLPFSRGPCVFPDHRNTFLRVTPYSHHQIANFIFKKAMPILYR